MVDPAAGFAFPPGGGDCGCRPIGNAPVERTTAMDIAMLALGFAFFAAALAYVSACDAL